MFRVAVPKVSGVGELNSTRSVQLPPGAKPVVAATPVMQVLVGNTRNVTPLVVPVMLKVIGPVEPPLPTGFDTVTVCAPLKAGPTVTNARLAGDAPSLIPAPLSATGEPVTATLEVSVTAPLSGPLVTGWKVTMIVQEPPTARVPPVVQVPPVRE